MQEFWNCCTILDLCLISEIIDGFWSSRCLNDRINLPDKIGSFSSSATTTMVVKNLNKKLLRVFLNVLNFLNMSHGNGSSTFVFQVTGILKPVTVFADKGLRLSHSQMVGCHSLYGSNFDFCMTNLDSQHPWRKLPHFGCKLLNKSQ